MTKKHTITRYIGKCPVCEGDFKLTVDKKMVHHGFTRPGDGVIHGDCFAVGYAPYEVSCAATKDYRAMVCEVRSGHVNTLAELTSGRVKTLTVRSWIRSKQNEEIDSSDPRWESILWATIVAQESSIHRYNGEISRCDKLIADWKPAAMRTVEEFEGLNKTERDEKAAKRAQDKADKLQAKIAGYQKRLATAVNNKTASTIADIFESAPDKLREMTGYKATRREAFDMLDRNSVFEAFGLDLNATRRENDDVISSMRYDWNKTLVWPASLK